MNKHYLDYNIYEWFKHFSIQYEEVQKPSQKHFPIKMAGYFNRVKEIYDQIKCQECETLCMPDTRYARTEHWALDMETGKIIKKDRTAAYRTTVFKCKNKNCSKLDITFYLNRCYGFGCYALIDSRKLARKCPSNLYICECGSCCERCFQNYSSGNCYKCGEKLNLYESDGERYVYCSSKAKCGYHIPNKDLTKKFTSQQQVESYIKGRSESNKSKKIGYNIGQKVKWGTPNGAVIQVEIVDILENNNIFKIQFSSGKTYRASRKQLDDCNNAEWKQLAPGESW